jgi:hypothetical protein
MVVGVEVSEQMLMTIRAEEEEEVEEQGVLALMLFYLSQALMGATLLFKAQHKEIVQAAAVVQAVMATQPKARVLLTVIMLNMVVGVGVVVQ